MMELITEKLGTLVENLIAWAPKLVGAIFVLIIGLWIIGGITRFAQKAMERSGLDKDVIPFLSSLVSVILKVLLLLSIAGMVGIETTSFIALIGMLGLAIGMALQGTLGHFASGVMILLFKPYRVGDLVDLQGQLGHVEEIQVFNTIIKTLDNKRVIVPNGTATSGIITNLSTHEYLRVDLNVAMPYEEDFDKVQGIIQNALQQVPKVMHNPTPDVEIEKFNEHNILLAVRPYAKTEDYWDVYFGAYRAVKAALGKHNIKVAYPKREVQVMNTTTLNGEKAVA
ncbi:MAG: mechanosensitive ion channel family protein [Saprospiraceae bacterium]|nr:mechanosensitive ion channel family protein [Saprospiraceae bacterium]